MKTILKKLGVGFGVGLVTYGLASMWEPLGYVALGVVLLWVVLPPEPPVCPVCGHDEEECKACALQAENQRAGLGRK